MPPENHSEQRPGSLWEKTALPSFPALNGEISTDVLIIGGGMAGLLTAYFLKQAGIPFILAEKEKIARGVTKNTTAKITWQHGLVYQKLAKRFGLSGARLYYEANRNALQRYEALAKTIPCHYEKKDNYIYSRKNRKKLEKELDVLEKIGVSAFFREKLPLPFSTAGAVGVRGQAEFHPLEFLAGLVKDLPIYENTLVREMKGTDAYTDRGVIHAKRVIVTTHFPFLNKQGGYYLKLYQHRSYVIALENAQSLDGMYLDEEEKGLSFRNYENLLLLGGGSHRTGKKGGNWEELRRFAKEAYPNAREVAFWATQDCMSLDGMPYIGRYALNSHDFYVASGFNKWGMTGSMLAAELLCGEITGQKNNYTKLFDPARSILHPQLFLNGGEAVINLLTPSKKRCPHLGCALKWNAAERTWDCPCHGSRFDPEGTLLENPANESCPSLKKEK